MKKEKKDKKMATFLQRVVFEGDYEQDGGAVDKDILRVFLTLYVLGDSDINGQPYMDDFFMNTPEQSAELAEIMALIPNDLLTSIHDKLHWIEKLNLYLFAGAQHYPGFETANAVRAKLGLLPL